MRQIDWSGNNPTEFPGFFLPLAIYPDLLDWIVQCSEMTLNVKLDMNLRLH